MLRACAACCAAPYVDMSCNFFVLFSILGTLMYRLGSLCYNAARARCNRPQASKLPKHTGTASPLLTRTALQTRHLQPLSSLSCK